VAAPPVPQAPAAGPATIPAAVPAVQITVPVVAQAVPGAAPLVAPAVPGALAVPEALPVGGAPSKFFAVVQNANGRWLGQAGVPSWARRGLPEHLRKRAQLHTCTFGTATEAAKAVDRYMLCCITRFWCHRI
jgi:hypothetical protein